MKNIKVLIADDSLIYRSQIKSALQDLPGIEISGVAANGKIAIEKLSQSPIDLLILDLEMPEMDGITTLREMAARAIHCKVIVFSSTSKRGADITLEALKLGASDFIAKPGASSSESSVAGTIAPNSIIRNLLEPKISALFPTTQNQQPAAAHGNPHSETRYPKVIWELFVPKVLVIGSSTGGPTVLETIFSQIELPLRCPVLIAQHMPPVFTASLAERLSKISGIPVAEAKHDEIISMNKIYVAPGDYHMSLKGTAAETRIVLDQGPQINFVRPAVDPLFASAAQIFGHKCFGIILTGMGSDGKVGSEQIKNAGGSVIIQEEKSCVVFGMPGAVMACGAYDKVLSPDEIILELQAKVTAKKNLPLAAGGK